jgi:uncharacterized lipoprotein
MNFDRVLLLVVASSALCGCHFFSKLNPLSKLNPDCHTAQEYQHAVSAAPLKVPPGLDSPNTQGALVIPTVGVVPPPPGPKDACLDLPPKYQPAPTSKSASS